MTVNINNASISSIRLAEQASAPATPAAGFVRVYANNATLPLLSMVDDAGTVTSYLGNSSGSGTGITFPATQSASSNANTLDDYEEGTWTPVATFSTSAGDRSHTTQVGRYTKVGRIVYLQGYLRFTETTASGNLSITGLPFVADTTASNYSAPIVYVSNMTGISGQVQGLVGADIAANTMQLFFSGTGTRANITNTNTGTNTDLAFSLWYQV